MNDTDIISALVGKNPAMWLKDGTCIVAIIAILGRAFHALMNGGGIMGIYRGLVFGTNVPAGNAGNGAGGSPTAQSVPIKTIAPLLLAVALLGACFGLTACAHLAPGADPLVVRTEQAQTDGKAAFDAILRFNNADRGLWATNAPAFSHFCAWLREPIVALGTPQGQLPRDLAMLWYLDQVKMAYKTGRATSNDLYTALITLTSAEQQATSWLSVVTNTPVQNP